MRLYRALCAALEAYAAAMSSPEEFGPEGAGEARSEHAHSFSHIEVHAGSQWVPAEVADLIARARRNQAAVFGI